MSHVLPIHVLTVCVMLAIPASAVFAQSTWYVDDNAPNDPCAGDPNCGDPNEDGSLAHPFDAIQEGIDAAVDDDTVRVLDGVYTGTGNRDTDFLGKRITVQSENGRDNCIVDCEGSDAEHHRAFILANNEEPTATRLEGFTICNGVHVRGGAIRCVSAGATIRNCAFTANVAIGTTQAYSGYGGAVYCRYADLDIADCVFTQNQARATSPTAWTGSNGAVACRESTLSLANCFFLENTAHESANQLTGWCGAVGCVEGSQAEIELCTFVGNRGQAGQGALGLVDSTAMVSGCLFAGNVGQMAGALWGDAMYSGSAYGQVVNCIFAGNRAIPISESSPFETWGGAIVSVRDHTLEMANCLLVGNTGEHGGGLDVGSSYASLQNCTIVANHAQLEGGGILVDAYSWSGTCDVANTVAWGNTPSQIETWPGSTANVTYSCVEDGWPGSGNIDADPSFVGGPSGTWTSDGAYDPNTGQTTFTDSAAGWTVDELVDKFLQPNPGYVPADPNDPNESSGYLQSLIVANTETKVTVWGDFEDLGTTGASYEVHDYHLMSASPCIDAGDNTAVTPDDVNLDVDEDTAERLPLDLDYIRRFTDRPATGDTGVDDPPDYLQVVDMGAYEYGTFGDTDGDADVDLSDLAQLLGSYGATQGPGYDHGDLDLDEDVDLSDLAALLGVYGTICE